MQLDAQGRKRAFQRTGYLRGRVAGALEGQIPVADLSANAATSSSGQFPGIIRTSLEILGDSNVS